MFKELIKLANHLDSKGFVKEADYLDRIIKESFFTYDHNKYQEYKDRNLINIETSRQDNGDYRARVFLHFDDSPEFKDEGAAPLSDGKRGLDIGSASNKEKSKAIELAIQKARSPSSFARFPWRSQ